MKTENKMKIIDVIRGGAPSLSFEVFPPKSFDNLDAAKRVIAEIAALSPSYMSVTYGAGGSTDIFTPEIASLILGLGVTPLAHLTCISSGRDKISSILSDLKMRGIENILALRGDIPDAAHKSSLAYKYASELTREISDFGGFCIGGACYPEGHPESTDLSTDIENLKYKIDAGCEFLTTQMFFDNSIIYSYMDKIAAAGIKAPIVPGIMPITSVGQIGRVVSISGNALPDRFIKMTQKYGSDPVSMRRAGIEYAAEQIIDLYAGGFNAVHVYSMNKPDVAQEIKRIVYKEVRNDI